MSLERQETFWIKKYFLTKPTPSRSINKKKCKTPIAFDDKSLLHHLQSKNLCQINHKLSKQELKQQQSSHDSHVGFCWSCLVHLLQNIVELSTESEWHYIGGNRPTLHWLLLWRKHKQPNTNPPISWDVTVWQWSHSPSTIRPHRDSCAHYWRIVLQLGDLSTSLCAFNLSPAATARTKTVQFSLLGFVIIVPGNCQVPQLGGLYELWMVLLQASSHNRMQHDTTVFTD